jgi:hypothetical protein
MLRDSTQGDASVHTPHPLSPRPYAIWDHVASMGRLMYNLKKN